MARLDERDAPHRFPPRRIASRACNCASFSCVSGMCRSERTEFVEVPPARREVAAKQAPGCEVDDGVRGAFLVTEVAVRRQRAPLLFEGFFVQTGSEPR